jgi:hypothetical protein
MTGPHVVEGRLTAPYYRNFLESELPLHRMCLLQHDMMENGNGYFERRL